MVKKEIEDQVKAVFADWQEATGLALVLNAEDVASLTALSTLEEIGTMQRTEFTKAFVDGVTDDIVKGYKSGITNGGSWCVEPVYEDIGGGMVKCTTRARFVPWLDDMSKEHTSAILDIFGEGEKAGVYPLDQARDVSSYFEGTRHRSVVAARTESQKIAQDARIQGYEQSGVKYLQYITAGDEKVRPTHVARNGKIYPIKKAPYIGEYQCRCILTEADYVVEEEGAKVEEDDSIILSKEALGIE